MTGVQTCALPIYGQLFSVDEEYFGSTAWHEIYSIDEKKTVSLPVPSIEELFILKICKFIGKDTSDLLSILAVQRIDSEYIKKRLIARGEYELARENYCDLNDNFKSYYNNWCYQHGADMDVDTKKSLIVKLQLQF